MTDADRDADRVARAYYRLRALRENLPQGAYVNEGWVTEYHDILTQNLTPTFETSEFQIPEKWLVHRHPRKLSKERFVGRNTFLAKLDAILGYFEFITQAEAAESKQQRIGFQGARKETD